MYRVHDELLNNNGEEMIEVNSFKDLNLVHNDIIIMLSTGIFDSQGKLETSKE